MPAYRRECSDLLVTVGVEVLLRIVDCHAPVNSSRQCVILHDFDALVATVRMLEKQHCGPVVAEVLTEGACCACALISNVPCHIRAEGIATDDLSDDQYELKWKGRWCEPGEDEPKVCSLVQRPDRAAGW